MKMKFAVLLFSGLLILSHCVQADEISHNSMISLGRDPEPPTYVENPNGTVAIHWNITYSSTASHVLFTVRNPDDNLVVDETYADSSGVVMEEYLWMVPKGASGGTYRVRIEYHSMEFGHEANAEVTFWVADPAVASDDYTWGMIKQLLHN